MKKMNIQKKIIQKYIIKRLSKDNSMIAINESIFIAYKL